MKSHDAKRKRNFHCALCPKKFFDIKTLQIHIETHTGEKWYRCVFCAYAANTGHSLDSLQDNIH